MSFPRDFIWATATAAYQVEGATDRDGRGLSTWDVIRRQPSRIADGSLPTLSCDHYDHYKDDVQLIKELNVTHYRLSICWTRILPSGVIDIVNEKGVHFYRSLLSELRKNGIEPIVTLFHADYPYALYKEGGWLNSECVRWYSDFCHLCFERFGDIFQVEYWITFNEIFMHAWSAVSRFEGHPHHSPDTVEYSTPKRRIPYLAAHNMLRAHAKVYRMYEREFRATQRGRIGIVAGGQWFLAVSDDPSDTAACQRAVEWGLNWMIEPVFGQNGDYPEAMKQAMNASEDEQGFELLPKFSKTEKEELKGSADFLGINYYRASAVCNGTGSTQFEKDAGFKYTDGPWERISGEDMWLRYVPEGLLLLLQYIQRTYAVPVMVTENGCADVVGAQAQNLDPLNDEHRIRYIRGHIEAVRHALESGCKVIGYTVWSLMDNFEWDDGFAVRFGLYRVDYESQERRRTQKNSGKFYRSLIEEARTREQ